MSNVKNNKLNKQAFSVVIPNYNGEGVLRETLDGVIGSFVKPEKIIIVDDLSTNVSRETLKQIIKSTTCSLQVNPLEWVSLIKNKENYGPTKSRNIGAREAVGEYIIFLDNDIVVLKDSFEKLVSFMNVRRGVGVCGAMIKNKEGDPMWWNAGWDLNIFRASVGRVFGFFIKLFPKSEKLKELSMPFSLNYWNRDKALKVDWVVEGCFIVRKDIFDEVGGFDEQFFMGHEGPDLCRMIRNKGYEVYFNPEVVVIDQENHTHSKTNRHKWLETGRLKYFKKWTKLRCKYANEY